MRRLFAQLRDLSLCPFCMRLPAVSLAAQAAWLLMTIPVSNKSFDNFFLVGLGQIGSCLLRQFCDNVLLQTLDKLLED